jgi:Cof subfamily protein (haloacid dehalogenase superfamily)
MIKLFATDLDGTILTRDKGFVQKDIEALRQIGEKDIIRVIATGRTLNSAKTVIPADFPVDYLVFSSGAGVYDWREGELLLSRHLGTEKLKELIPLLSDRKLNFTLHWPIPDNHIFYFSEAEEGHADFLRFLKHNSGNALEMDKDLPEKDYTQILAFLPDVETYRYISGKVSGIKTVRATSPIDGKSVWMEFFHHSVSKAEGIKFICSLKGIDKDEVVVLGNDFNDLDMLKAFNNAYVVSNSPEELKEKYGVVSSSTDGPAADLIKKLSVL